MEKPDRMVLREWLIKKVATTLIVPEKVVNAVITHQFDTAYEALETNNSVEIYEFGKFVFNVKKAEHEIKKHLSQKEMYEKRLEDEDVSEKLKHKARLKLETVNRYIEEIGLKIKGNENK